MATSEIMVHPSGVQKQAFVGFSWTTFFFGCLVPLFRGDFKFFAIFLFVGVVNWLALGAIIGAIGAVVWGIVCATCYNEWHRNDLLLAGFQ